jgi:hypothetical protein
MPVRIVEVLTYIFRRKNYSDYVSKRQKIREAGTDAGGYSNGKAKRIRKRSRKLSVSLLSPIFKLAF